MSERGSTKEYRLAGAGELEISYEGTGKIVLKWGPTKRKTVSKKDGRRLLAKLTPDMLVEKLGEHGAVSGDNVQSLAELFDVTVRTVYRVYATVREERAKKQLAARRRRKSS